MKTTILLLAFFGVFTISASAQNSVTPVKQVLYVQQSSYNHTTPVADKAVSSAETNNSILDTIQKESENTIIYPLVRMAETVKEKIASIKFEKRNHNHQKKNSH